MGKFYITTAIDYVNGAPHIGHAYEKIITDTIARHFRQRGTEVFFLTGTDEHGTKIQKTAAKNNMSALDYVNMTSQKFIDAWKDLNISYDNFIRTTNPEHRKAVQGIFQKLVDQGDIYKEKYTGLYCSGCEKFITPKELLDNKCPIHDDIPSEICEENYFFKLTKYKNKLLEHIKANEKFILPEFRKNEIIYQLENIEDISVSRSRESVEWGIAVPNDESQTIYVWIDALSNYITGIGFLNDETLYKKFWPANVHVIGKDITKFHAIFWPAMLMALDIPLPESLAVHGFITVDESKISKSLGNVVNPIEITAKYSLKNHDALRYYLLSNAYLGKDVNFSETDFVNKVDADLANNLGNLLNRTLTMLVKYNDGIIPKEINQNPDLISLCKQTRDNVINEFDNYQLGGASETIIKFVDYLNKYINEKSPWSLAKTPEGIPQCLNILYQVLEALRWISILIEPFIPNIAEEMQNQLLVSQTIDDKNILNLTWGSLKEGLQINKESISPVFLRIGSQLAGDKKKK